MDGSVGIDPKAPTGSIPKQVQRVDPELVADAFDTLHGEVPFAALDGPDQRAVPPDGLAERLLRKPLGQAHAANVGTHDGLQDPFQWG